MDAIGKEQLAEFLASSEIGLVLTENPAERQLIHHPRRAVKVYFSKDESLDYQIAVTSRILDMDEEWWLMTRYGPVAELGLLSVDSDVAAIAFHKNERAKLGEYLCIRPMDHASASTDLYVVGLTRHILVSWDHHTADEGLEVELKYVVDATRLLSTLNELGTELSLFHSGN